MNVKTIDELRQVLELAKEFGLSELQVGDVTLRVSPYIQAGAVATNVPSDDELLYASADGEDDE